jgi:peroxiredoxin
VVKAFNKFKDKNFTILGVSLDQQKDAWVKAIEKDKLAWTHVSDLQSWNNSVAQMYRVQSIPQNFLIDPNGKIIAKDLRGVDLEKKLCELLGCNTPNP